VTVDHTQQLLQSSGVYETIEQINFLNTGEYMLISAHSGLVTNKTGTIISTTDWEIVIDPSLDCESRFVTAHNWGFALTQKALCVYTNTQQQIFTYEQLLSGIQSIDRWSGIWIQLTGITHLLSWDTLYIDTTVLGHVHQDLVYLTTNKQLAQSLVDTLQSFKGIFLGVLIVMVLIFAFFSTLYHVIVFILYSLLTWALAYILGMKDITLGRAFSLTWLPLLIIKMFALVLWFGIIVTSVCLLIVIGLIIHYTSPKL
jgi:uncharacterized membrane protein